MDAKERLIRRFYEARSRRDWTAVRELLAPDVVWHELGPEQDYSGVHRGRDRVTPLLERLVGVTGGSFSLEPVSAITTAEHVAISVRWHAERGGRQVDGYDLAVFRIAGGKIAEAWFFPDGFDPEALTEVFSFQRGP
jgi:ketosteroid isomerase-like protein